jgi:hypothetical protein
MQQNVNAAQDAQGPIERALQEINIGPDKADNVSRMTL